MLVKLDSFILAFSEWWYILSYAIAIVINSVFILLKKNSADNLLPSRAKDSPRDDFEMSCILTVDSQYRIT